MQGGEFRRWPNMGPKSTFQFRFPRCRGGERATDRNAVKMRKSQRRPAGNTVRFKQTNASQSQSWERRAASRNQRFVCPPQLDWSRAPLNWSKRCCWHFSNAPRACIQRGGAPPEIGCSALASFQSHPQGGGGDGDRRSARALAAAIFGFVQNRGNCGWLRDIFSETLVSHDSPTKIPTNNGFNHGFKVVQDVVHPQHVPLGRKPYPKPIGRNPLRFHFNFRVPRALGVLPFVHLNRSPPHPKKKLWTQPKKTPLQEPLPKAFDSTSIQFGSFSPCSDGIPFVWHYNMTVAHSRTT